MSRALETKELSYSLKKKILFPPLCLQEVIPTFDMAVNELFFERFPDSVLEHQIQVRPYNALKTRNMRSLNPEGEFDSRVTSVSLLCVLIDSSR